MKRTEERPSFKSVANAIRTGTFLQFKPKRIEYNRDCIVGEGYRGKGEKGKELFVHLQCTDFYTGL